MGAKSVIGVLAVSALLAAPSFIPNSSPLDAPLPPLPDYKMQAREPLVSWADDKTLSLLAPVAAYWVVSLFWHAIDELDVFPQYRLHTPAEILKRNHAGRWEVFRDVISQQIIQMITGFFLNMTEPEDMVGKEQYDIAVWAQRLRMASMPVFGILNHLGYDAYSWADHFAQDGVLGTSVPRFNERELALASAVYHYIFPALQFFLAIVVLDTWQYFLHRAMHLNKWLYTTFHSRHHRLYVPYAYGALYNHPFEGFLLDTLGAVIAFKVAGFSTLQGLCFFAGSTIKTVDDHCGYHLPWDPMQLLTGNNAAYHDIHHQSWGIKSNFSQPFFTFWDRALGTVWTGGDVSAKYERSRAAAQKKVDDERARSGASSTTSLASDSMKGLRERVGTGRSGHSRKGSLLGVEH